MEDMRYVERKLQQIMEELEKYLRNIPMDKNVWDDIIALEKKLEYHVEAAYEYQNIHFSLIRDITLTILKCAQSNVMCCITCIMR